MYTDLEMKQVNEEILAKWRSFGFLAGLKEGSQMEWRCAKSMNLLAEYLINGDEDEALNTITFAIIRRVICSGRPRVNRILKPEEIIEPMKTVTALDVMSTVYSYKNFKPTYKQYVMRILDYFKLSDKSMLEAIKGLNDSRIKAVDAILDIDLQAEFVAVYSQYLNIIYAKKDED